jgi:hypothetical protein
MLSIIKHIIRITILLLFTIQTFAQNELLVPTNFRQSYKNNVREKSGLPGKNYWQNRADYFIKVQFSPNTRELSGHVETQYKNNSPDTLNKIVFKLFPNLYKTESVRTKSISKDDLGDGIHIESILLNGQKVNSKLIFTSGTNMTVKGVKILPNEKIAVQIKYSYILNQNSFIRTGQFDSGAFVVAYFFPKNNSL